MRTEYEKYPRMLFLLGPGNCKKDKLGLPQIFISEYACSIPKNIKLHIPNGRQVHVIFDKRNNCLSRIGIFLKEISESYGAVFVFTYKENGDMLVYMLNDNGSKVQYPAMRTIPRGLIYKRGNDCKPITYPAVANVTYKSEKEANIAMDKWERLILFILPDKSYSEMLKLPGKFIERHGAEILEKMVLQLPNGEEFTVNFFLEKESVSNPSGLTSHFTRKFGLILVLSYIGDGRFLVMVLNDGRMENQYGSLVDSSSGSRSLQDTMGGKGWNFFHLATGRVMADGGIDIPSSFLDRFGDMIPRHLNVNLVNGEVFDGLYYANMKQIRGLDALFSRRYVEKGDIVLLTYRGDADFDMCIFDTEGVEKLVEMKEPDNGNDAGDDPVWHYLVSDTEDDTDGDIDAMKVNDLGVDHD